MLLPQSLFKTPRREAASFFLLGALGGLAFAPLHWWGCFLVSISLLLVCVEEKPNAHAVFRSLWWWSFGQFCVVFHWISFSLGVDWGKFFWILPFALVGIPAAAALFPSMFCSIFWTRVPSGVNRWLLFSAMWGLSEWVRGHWIFGGFGWNSLSAIWGDFLPMLQSLAWWGPHGLSVVTLLILSAPALAFSKRFTWLSKTMILSCMTLMFFGLIFSGSLRVMPTTYVAGCYFRLVQPNVDQKVKWSNQGAGDRVLRLFEMTRKSSEKPLTHILWPEAPLPFVLPESKDLRDYLLPLKSGQFLLTGMLRVTKGQGNLQHIWNSLMVFDSHGRIRACYDKAHLVPFGEYIPGRAFVDQWIDTSWLKIITAGERDFAAGPGARALELDKGPAVSPLVCFDVAFPGDVVPVGKRPGWLLDITNDAWFGGSWGLYQHFEQGRFRAIEEGLPLVRVANTGISGVIDPYGQILAQLPILTELYYDFDLPQAIQPTFYSRWREIPFWIMVSVLIGLSLVRKRKPSVRAGKKRR